jgi:hypothetical protein
MEKSGEGNLINISRIVEQGRNCQAESGDCTSPNRSGASLAGLAYQGSLKRTTEQGIIT